MKKTLLIILTLFAAKAFSQTVSYGLTAGVNYSAVPGNGNPTTSLLYSFTNSYKIGFRVGGLVDIGFKNLALQPGLIFTNVGGQSSAGNAASEVSLNYIQVPVNLLYKWQDGGAAFFIGGGPYIAFGTSATRYWDYHQETENFQFGSGGLPYPEVGLNALLGYKLNMGMVISAGFSHGFTDVYGYNSNNKNEGFNLSVSYFFSSK